MNNLRVLSIFTNNPLSWESGYDYVLYALSNLDIQNIKFILNIVGEGPLHAALTYSIEDLELTQFVKIYSPNTASAIINRCYSECDVFINYSFKPLKISNNEWKPEIGKYIITTETANNVIGNKVYKIERRSVKQLENAIKQVYKEIING